MTSSAIADLRPAAPAWPMLASTLLLLALVVGGGGLQWIYWQDVLDTRERIAERQDLIAGLAQSAARLRANPAAAAVMAPNASAYLAGETDTIAAADFQARVLRLVESHPAIVFSTQVRSQPIDEVHTDTAPQPAAPGQRINLELTFDAHMADVQAILFEIETGLPVMLVAETQMQPVRSAQVGESPDEDPALHVRLALYGFWRK